MLLPWLLRIWLRLPLPIRMRYLRLRYGRFAVGVAALIRDQDGAILLVRRTYSQEEPWAMPGGWLERGDLTIERALQRELYEETGLRVSVGRVCAVERTDFAVVLLMQVDLLDGTSSFRPSAEVAEIAWVGPDRVGQLSPMNARLLRQALGASLPA